MIENSADSETGNDSADFSMATVNPAELQDFNHDENEAGTASNRQASINQLPLARVKKIMKEDKSVNLISQDALFLTAIATELFTSYLAKESYEFSKYEKRKTLNYKDLMRCIREIESMEFLLDVIPETVPIKYAMDERKKMFKEVQNYNLPSVAPEAADEENLEADLDSKSTLATPVEDEIQVDN